MICISYNSPPKKIKKDSFYEGLPHIARTFYLGLEVESVMLLIVT